MATSLKLAQSQLKKMMVLGTCSLIKGLAKTLTVNDRLTCFGIIYYSTVLMGQTGKFVKCVAEIIITYKFCTASDEEP